MKNSIQTFTVMAFLAFLASCTPTTPETKTEEKPDMTPMVDKTRTRNITINQIITDPENSTSCAPSANCAKLCANGLDSYQITYEIENLSQNSITITDAKADIGIGGSNPTNTCSNTRVNIPIASMQKVTHSSQFCFGQATTIPTTGSNVTITLTIQGEANNESSTTPICQ